MKFVKQALSLQVNNIDTETKCIKKRHSSLFPNTIRCIICGPSNCGKTNVMLSLLLHENGLKFRNVFLYSKTAFQSKYCFLKSVFQKVPQLKFKIFNNGNDIMHPTEAPFDSVLIFDDVICENQSNILNYFTMGRHKNIDCFYLTQTYSKIPKQLLRDNVNFLIVFKQDDVNLRHIYNEHVNTDMEWSKFKTICCTVWKEPFNFMTINKDSPLNEGRYRQAFDTFITL